MMECKHEFVSFFADKFVCRDCPETFDYLPGDEPAEINPKAADIRDAIQGFKEAICTLGEAAEATRLSVQEFAEAVKRTFRAKPTVGRIQTLGGKSFMQVTGYEPARTSCPLEIDQMTDLMELQNGNFPDVVSVSCEDETMDRFTLGKRTPLKPVILDQHYIVEFCDGTQQRVNS